MSIIECNILTAHEHDYQSTYMHVDLLQKNLGVGTQTASITIDIHNSHHPYICPFRVQMDGISQWSMR